MRQGQYIKNSAIHDTYNRCVEAVHGTNFVRVENNVTYSIVGHCFFLEDGIEHGNRFTLHNLCSFRLSAIPRKACVPYNLAPNGELSSAYENRQAMRQASVSGKDTTAAFGQHRGGFLDHQPGQHVPRQRGSGFR